MAGAGNGHRSVSQPIDEQHRQTAIDAVTAAEKSLRTVCDQLTTALATLAPLAPDSQAAANYRHARDIVNAQLAALDNAVSMILP